MFLSFFLFNSGIKNNASILFTTSNGLNVVQDLIINRKIYIVLGVAQLHEIPNLVKLKGTLNWVSAILTDLDQPINFYHFGFAFETKNPNDVLHFMYLLLNEKDKFIKC